MFLRGQTREISDSLQQNHKSSISKARSIQSSLLLGSLLFKVSSLSAPTKIEELRVGSDEFVFYLLSHLKTLCAYYSHANTLSVTWFSHSGEPLQNQALLCPLGTRNTDYKITRELACGKERPYQQKSLASPFGMATIEPFSTSSSTASCMTSQALLLHIKQSYLHTK